MSFSKSPNKGFLLRAHSVLAGLGLLYGLAIVLVMTPFVQTYVLYAHHIDFFGYTKFDHPENYGLAPGKTVNLKLRSADNTTLGAWFMLSDRFYRGLPFPPAAPQDNIIPEAIRSRPTILFLHGNTGTRALPLRITVYTGLTSRLDSNVLAIDYRGFGDSEGHPSVHGVSLDAHAGWNYLIDQGARPEDIVIVGHSLGTAVAGLLAAQLGREGVRPRGVVLLSPFSSVRALIDTYCLFGFLPLLKPLAMIPVAPRLLTWSLAHKFDTLTLVPDINSSVLIAHGENDWDIPSSHSSVLFEAFLDPHLPYSPSLPENPISWGESEWETYAARQTKRDERRKELVTTTSIHNFGTLDEFIVGGRKVALLKTIKGGHDIGRIEGVQDAIGRMFDLP